MILIDTTPLVALCDPRDSKHRSSVKQLASLVSEPLTTCDAVVTEACFHLPHRSQRQRLRALIRELRVQPHPTEQTAAFWLAVLDWLEKYSDHEPDWADGCLAVLSSEERRARVWTYDREFHTTWRRPDGTTIPLAVKPT